jgi:hypothetical protein
MKEIDFADEDAVLAEMAQELDIDPGELSVEEDRGLGSFRTGTVYRVTAGRKEWVVVESEDQMRELALEVVKQDLEHEPEIFNRDFIENHIDMDRLRQDLHSDLHSERYDYYSDMDAEDFWREADGYGMDVPEEDEDGEQRDPTGGEIDDLADRATDELLKDPMSYLEDIYGRAEAVEQAIKIAGIDIDAAAEEAVNIDGAAHFLARYDGRYDTTRNGLVYWRDN